MKKLWKTSLCLMAATTLFSASYAEEADALDVKPCCEKLGRCRWTSHELFAHVTGFESEPMSVMMEKLTPDNPELWDLYSDSIGNLLLANLFLGADKDVITNATYELRFHEEMTFATAFAAFETAMFYPGCRIAEEGSKAVELFLHAMMMDTAIDDYFTQQGIYDADEVNFATVLDALRYFGCLQSESTSSTRASFSTEPYNPANSFAEAKLPLTCQATFNLFATKDTAKVTWLDEETFEEMKEDYADYADFFNAPEGYDFAQALTNLLPLEKADEVADEVEAANEIKAVAFTDEGLPVICTVECEEAAL